MKIEDLSIAVFVDCPNCEGSGSVRSRDAFFIDVETGKPVTRTRCGKCNGHGKIPIFIPLAELFASRRELNDATPLKTPDLVNAVGRWLEGQEDQE